MKRFKKAFCLKTSSRAGEGAKVRRWTAGATVCGVWVACVATMALAASTVAAWAAEDLVSVRQPGCGQTDVEYKSLDGKGVETLSLLSLKIDGAPPAGCESGGVLPSGAVASLKTASGAAIYEFPAAPPDAELAGSVRVLEFAAEGARFVKWRFSFNAEPGERFYGFGEKANAFDQRGKVTRIINLDAFAPGMTPRNFKEDRSYKTVPFFMSDRGYGFWLDDSVVAEFDMDSKGEGRWTLSFESDRARLYFIAGPKLTDVLSRFTALTGRPPMWPKWVYGPWKSRNVHNNRVEVEEDILRQRELDVPGSVIVIDSPWETCYNDYRFNEKQFPDPAGMLRLAHEQGYKVLLWITPMVNLTNTTDMEGIAPMQCDNYTPLRKRGAFVKDRDGRVANVKWWKGSGAMLDFTNPSVAAYWKDMLKRLMAFGADGFKTDDGESHFAIEGRYADGTPGARMQNRYSYLYAKYTYEAVRESEKGDGAVWQRSGFTGTQKYSIPWPGDNHSDFGPDGLPSIVINGQSAAMSGFQVWGHDIGGYIGGQTPELFVRWAQFGALTPIMQIHTTSNIGAWSFGPEALDIYRKYAKLHTGLFPYFYALNAEAAETGLPMMRPLPLLYQDDAEAHVQRYEYLLGADLLVAPVVTEGAVKREVYFPGKGAWIDWWNGREYKGGTKANVDAPLDVLPLFARKGAVIPMLPEEVDTLVDLPEIKARDVTPMDDRLIVRAFPSAGPSNFRTQDGLELSVLPGDKEIAFCAKGPARRIAFDVWGVSPKKASRDGKKLSKTSSGKAKPGGNEWSIDRSGRAWLPLVSTSQGACVTAEL